MLVIVKDQKPETSLGSLIHRDHGHIEFWSYHGRIVERFSARSNGSSSATPTAAPAADQPTSLASPLVLRSLALPALYPLPHTSDATSTSLASRVLIGPKGL